MPEETIVAVYDNTEHADAAVRDLESINVPQSAITRHSGTGTPGSTVTGNPGGTEPVREKGFWSSLFGGETGHDESVYDRSLEHGSSVVTVRVSDEHVQRVTDVLERHNPIDIDERAASYGTAGTTGAGLAGSTTTTTTTTERDRPVIGQTTGMTGAGATTGATGVGTGHATGASTGATTGATTGHTAGRTGEDVLSLSEEQLNVGKRLVNRGTTRIRRFVVETPVEEAVNLHSERVTIERRPVTGDARPTTSDFTDRTVEVTETDEEAVVAKTAHVREEVVINKTATDRTETVHDTVRREDVEITKDGQASRADNLSATERAARTDELPANDTSATHPGTTRPGV